MSSNNICAPNHKDLTNSCFTNEELHTIIDAWNSKVSKSEQIDKKMERGKMIQAIRTKFQKQCKDDETCWLEQGFLDPEIKMDLIESFKPEKPTKWEENPKEWASTIDIDAVLSQYEKKYEDFKYLGAVPIDFDSSLDMGMCVVDELCKIDVEALWLDGIRRIGIVFNLDPHDKPGSHWVSLFVNLTNGGIYFFDSVGSYPPREIEKLMTRIKDDLNNSLLKETIQFSDMTGEHCVKTKLTKSAKKNMSVLSVANTEWLVMGGIIYIMNKGELSRPYKIVKLEKNVLKVEPTLRKPYKKGSKLIQQCWISLYNDVQHQYENTECGIYSIYFLTQLLEGRPFLELVQKKIRDKKMNQFRDVFFRENNTKINLI